MYNKLNFISGFYNNKNMTSDPTNEPTRMAKKQKLSNIHLV
jgi:hypothetical protein